MKEIILSLLFLQMIDGQTVGQAVNITNEGQTVNFDMDGQAINTSTVRQAVNINTTIGQANNISIGYDKMTTGEQVGQFNLTSISQVVNITTIGQVVNLTTVGQTIGMTTVEPTVKMTTDSAIDVQTANMTTVVKTTPLMPTNGSPDIGTFVELPPLMPFITPPTPQHSVGRLLLGCTATLFWLEPDLCSFNLQTPPSHSTERFLTIYIPEVALSEFIILSKLSPLQNGASHVHLNQTTECFQYVLENDEWVLTWFGNQPIFVELSNSSYQESEEYPYCHLEICNITTTNYIDQTCSSPPQVTYYDDVIMCLELSVERQSTKRAVAYVSYDCALSCAQNCTCTLGNTKLITQCSHGIVHSSLIVLQPSDRETLRLLFGSTIMKLDSNAFLTVNEIQRLYLSYAGFTTINVGAFNGLKRLQQLNLGHNNLLEIQRGLFNHLHNLINLDLGSNNIRCISLGSFEGLWKLYILDVSKNDLSALTPGIFQNMTNLYSLLLGNNSIGSLQPHLFFDCFNLHYLDLSSNAIADLPLGIFRNTLNLQHLKLQNNVLKTISDNTFEGLCNLKSLNLASNRISEIQSEVFQWSKSFKFNISIIVSNYPSVCSETSEDDINISFKQEEVRLVSDNTTCQSLQMLTDLDLTDNNLQRINFKTFASLNATITVDEDWICCFIPTSPCVSNANKDVFLTCDTLLPDNLTRTFLWIFAFMACFGNCCVLVWRLYSLRKKPGNTVQQVQSILIINLALSDLLMGIYLFIIVSADAHFGEYFPQR